MHSDTHVDIIKYFLGGKVLHYMTLHSFPGGSNWLSITKCI